MAFNELELKAMERALDDFLRRRRPPAHIREELDVEARISGQSVEIVEVRPRRKEPGKIIETPAAKLTFNRTKGLWKIYWMRKDLKWHGYEPTAQVGTLEIALREIDDDRYGCFFG